MKVTPIQISSAIPLYEPGTGRFCKEEIYPTTDTLMKRLHVSKDIKDKVIAKQKEKDLILPDIKQLDMLRPYQKQDVAFLVSRKCAACFNEQRTGKTPTALITMNIKNIQKLLIIAPASTLYTWAEECKRWWSNTLPITILTGTAERRKKLIKAWDKGAMIISYECLRVCKRIKKDEYGDVESISLTGDLNLITEHKDIQGCILDEAHRIKNHKSAQANALMDLTYIPNRLALTGTPAPGKPYEIFSILQWLYPTIFTGYWRFIDYYFTQFDEYINYKDTVKCIGGFKNNKDKELQEFLDVISTRRLRASVMSWLPDKDREVIKLDMTKEQTKYIQDLIDNFEIEGTDVDAANVLARIIKTRQILLAPELLNLKGKSPKIEWLKQYIKDYPNKSIIIFSNFTEWLKLLGKELDTNNFIIGETPKDERERLKNDFQNGKIKLLLINIKAGKEGLTLDTADTEIFTDKFPPVGDILQAEDRFIATSKEKADKGHTIIDLIMSNSYEEAILSMLKSNAKDIDVVNNYINYIKGGD